MVLKKILKWTGVILFIFFLLLFVTIEKIPFDKNYKHSDSYLKTLETVSSLQLEKKEKAILLVGWDAQSITPNFEAPLLGYGRTENYESISDSIQVKVILMQSQNTLVAFLSYDLLIIHPEFANSIREMIYAQFPNVSNIVFSATHSHSSIGGFAGGLASHFILGGKNSEVCDLLEQKTKLAIQNSFHNLDTAKVGFSKISQPNFVKNRLDTDFDEDSYVRILHFEKTNGKKGAFVTYSAHATCLYKKDMSISADYPSLLASQLKINSGFDFVIFAAGTVGSHAPNMPGYNYSDLQRYGNSLGKTTSQKMRTQNIEFDSLSDLSSKRIFINPPSPTLRIDEKYRVRSWLFNMFFGKTNPYLDYIKINNKLILTLPCELSGEFSEELDNYASRYGLELILTTFNGEYLGYVVPDKHYHLDHQETREMSWQGPFAGSIYRDYIKLIIHQIGISNSR